MKQIRGYWDKRLERWAYWRSGAGSVRVATFRTLRVDNMRGSDEPPEPDEQRETELLVAHLAGWQQQLMLAVYPRHARAVAGYAATSGQSLSAVYSAMRRTHGDLQRLLDRRRKGEPLTLDRPPRRPRAVRTQFASALAG